MSVGKFEVNFTNRSLYTLITLFGIMIFSIGVFALSAGETPDPGHNIQNVGPPSSCSGGQILSFTGSAWACVNDQVGEGGGTSLWSSGSGGAIYYNGGNVGIGTGSPHAPLQLSNVLSNRRIVLWEDADNNHQYYGLGINSGAMRYQVSGSSSNHTFYSGTSSSSSNELMRIQGNGNVGIGTSAPERKLHVEGHLLLSDIFGSGIKIKDDFGGNWDIIGSLPDGGFIIKESDNNVFMIANGGNVGIGTTAPSQKLHVNGNDNQALRVSGGSSNRLEIGYDESYKRGRIQAYGDSFEEKHLVINPAADGIPQAGAGGYVGIGIIDNPAYLLDVGGNIRAKGGLQYIRLDMNVGSGQPAVLGGSFNVGGGSTRLFHIISTGEMTIEVNDYAGRLEAIRIDTSGNVKISDLAGSGNAYACVTSDGTLYRSSSPCA